MCPFFGEASIPHALPPGSSAEAWWLSSRALAFASGPLLLIHAISKLREKLPTLFCEPGICFGTDGNSPITVIEVYAVCTLAFIY